MIRVVCGRAEKIDRAEALRYVRASADDETAAGLFSSLEKIVLENQNLKACYDVFPISADGGQIDLGFARVKSRSLSLYLKGCSRIILFACTAGVGIDRLIARYSAISPARAAMVQAMGSALAESWCDMLCAELKGEFATLNSRFSCGYGDLPLTLQRDIFSALEVTKRIGISLSDDCFMTPSKSVTAIVGIRD